MSERYLYGGDNQFVGSMDDDGRIYDDRHGLMGYIRNGTVYDNCNLPMGRITESGMVVDNFQQEVGQEYGTGFCAPGVRRQMGLVRAGTLSEGSGRDYGAFYLLDRKRRHGDGLYDNREDDDEYGDEYDDEYDPDSGEDYDDGGLDEDIYDDCGSTPAPRRRNGGGNQAQEIEASAFGCFFVFAVVAAMALFFTICAAMVF